MAECADKTTMAPLSLIVTADDFGIGRRTSEGIIHAHLHGPVTATSLMVVTGDHLQASLPLLAEAPNLDVGLHIVLTKCGHRPLMAGKSSGLCDEEGFVTNGRLWLKAFAGRLDRKAVADEIAAQAQAFRKIVGRAPAYVDAHHHSHQLPTIRDALAEVIASGLLPPISRKTIEPAEMLRSAPGTKRNRRAANFLGRRAAKKFSAAGVWSNDFYFGMLDPAALKQEFPWQHFLKHLPESGVIEWVVHPGHEDETLIPRDTYITERAVELHALTDPSTTRYWEHLRPSLTRKSVLASA
jgi:chitin disaccharide deacetylase